MDNKGKRSLLHMPSFQDSIFVGLCSGGLLAYSLYHHYFDKNTSEWKTSPFLFPTLIAVFGLLLTVSLVMDALQERRADGQAEKKPAGKKNLVGVLVLIAAALVYYFLMPLLHFIPATLVFLAFLFVYLGERTWWKIALLSVITTVAIYVLFGMALHVRLP